MFLIFNYLPDILLNIDTTSGLQPPSLKQRLPPQCSPTKVAATANHLVSLVVN